MQQIICSLMVAKSEPKLCRLNQRNRQANNNADPYYYAYTDHELCMVLRKAVRLGSWILVLSSAAVCADVLVKTNLEGKTSEQDHNTQHGLLCGRMPLWITYPRLHRSSNCYTEELIIINSGMDM
jgi:hypothetical protein